MKNFFKTYRREVIIFSLLILFYFVLRLIKILDVPIFTDEAIYLRWAQIAGEDAAQRFISLTDGKQPLFIWITIFFMRFIHEPLLAGRLVSVYAGCFTMIGLFFLAKELFKNHWIGIFSMLLYVLHPLALVYDRLAIYDSLVGTFYVWGLYCSVLLIKNIQLDRAFMLGFVLGAAALNKIGAFSIYLLPFNALLFDFKQKNRGMLVIKAAVLFGVAFVIEQVIYSILRLSPWFYIIKQKNATFFYPLSDLLHRPVSFWIGNFSGNIHGLLSWLVPYITIPILVLVIFAFVFYKEFWREKLLLLLYFLIPFMGFALIAKVMYPRYLLFMTLGLLPLAAYALYKFIGSKNILLLRIAIIVIFISVAIYTDIGILTHFAAAPIPDSDKNQLVNDWPAGGGVKEAVQFFKQQSQTRTIYIGTEGTFGLMPYALELYLKDNSNITIHSFWPIHDTPPQEAIDASKIMPTYFLFYQPCPGCQTSGNAPVTWHAKLVKRYIKGIGKTYLSIYQLL